MIIVQGLEIGKKGTVSIQSMTNTDTHDKKATEQQMLRLFEAGADLVRISTPDIKSVGVVAELQKSINKPLCADIHFDYKLAIASADSGIAKIRINPGTLGSHENYIQVIEACKKNDTVMRIGLNLGSLEKKYSNLKPIEAMMQSLQDYVLIAEENKFDQIILSAKSSDVLETIEVNHRIKAEFPYPIHIGVTEAGTKETALAKSYSAMGTLLLEGIGDTIRISISGDPIDEVLAARKLLNVLHLREGAEVIACPTCARTFVKEMPEKARFVEAKLEEYGKKLSFAVMGCNVNGPGESARADIGITFGPKRFTVMKDREIIGTHMNCDFEKVAEELIANA